MGPGHPRRLTARRTAAHAAVGSLGARVLPGTRRFQGLGAAGGDELPELPCLERRARTAQADPAANLVQDA